MLADGPGTGSLHSLVHREVFLKLAFLKGRAAWHGPGQQNLLGHLLSPQGLQQPAGTSNSDSDFFKFQSEDCDSP